MKQSVWKMKKRRKKNLGFLFLVQKMDVFEEEIRKLNLNTFVIGI